MSEEKSSFNEEQGRGSVSGKKRKDDEFVSAIVFVVGAISVLIVIIICAFKY